MPDGSRLARWLSSYPMCIPLPPAGTFELGLCMAGAVSAGAYTAGVLDLLVEALDAFEAEKARRRASGEAPLHDVQVAVLGGASAGGMCAALGAVFLDADFPHVTPGAGDAAKADNPLYDAWVRRIDMRHLLGVDDLAGGEIRSALDCTVLDEIVESLVDKRQDMQDRARPWLADPLRVMLTLANLKGVPYALRFGGAGDAHFMWRHADYMRFAVPTGLGAGAGAAGAPDETVLDRALPRGSPLRELFKAVTLGTGAFPVALRPRVIRRPRADYEFRGLLHPRSRLAEALAEDPNEGFDPLPYWAEECRPDWDDPSPEHAMLCVDGGAMDNEPLDLVRRGLAGWNGHNERDGHRARRAVLLVDPFANKEQPGPADDVGLLGAIMPLFNALVRNSRFKAEDLALAAAPDTYSRFLIAPSRGTTWKAKGAIASGYLNGFMGFFSEAYRHHDYMLGRRNARSFLRRHLVLPMGNALFQDGRWSDADRSRHLVRRAPDGPEDHLPIIPLFGRLAPQADPAADDAVEPMPKWPAGAFNAKTVEEPIRQRAHRVTELVYEQFVVGKLDRIARENTDKIIASQSWLLRGPLRFGRRILEPRLLPRIEEVLRTAPAQYVTRAAVDQIATAVIELDKAELA
ncbi:hypothetical protein [Elioraea sp.]|uniref:hypothetical protein n=1 Tax=Elioraea sp. TaxID=2185103 RepID=UPI003F71D0C4